MFVDVFGDFDLVLLCKEIKERQCQTATHSVVLKELWLQNKITDMNLTTILTLE